VPILLLRPECRRVTEIRDLLVPTDATPGGSVALGYAVGLAKATGAHITIVQVSVPISMQAYAGYAIGGIPYYDPAWDVEALTSARGYVQALAGRLRDTGIPAEGEAYECADVAQAIVALANTSKADIVVMSTHALTGPARALLGSVADAVVRQAPCPVLLMHRAETALPITLDPCPLSSEI
jgi:universal stress protein A